MFSISTSWFKKDKEYPDNFFNLLKELGVYSIELGVNTSDKDVKKILKSIKSNNISIISLHNYCPLPGNIKKGNGSGDIFSLSSTDLKERLMAIKYTIKTIKLAHKLQSKYVIIHSGDVLEARNIRKSNNLNMFKPDNKCIEDIIKTRDKFIQDHLDSLAKSMHTLTKYAKLYNIKIGLENRYHIDEIPTFNEARWLIERVSRKYYGIWLDVGHLKVQANVLKFDFLSKIEKYKNYFIGCHLHDVNNNTDHIPPGEGSIPFAHIKNILNSNLPLVIELSDTVSQKRVASGLNYLRKIWVLD